MSILVEPSAESLEPSDSELISQVRAGDQHAQEMLYARHYDVALRVAYRHSNSPAEAEDLVATGFEKVFSILQTDNGPEAFFRAYLCTTVSRLAFAYNNHEKRQTLTDDFSVFERGTEHADPVMNQFESGVVGEAFRSLPERWQAVLWYTEIDGLKPAEVAPMLGLSPNGVSALAVRAREGLRQAYLQGHIKVSTGDQCQAFSRQLGAYVRGGLSARNEAKVDEHLADCNKCTAILLQINDVSSSMRGIIAPLFLGGITALGIPSAVTSGAALSISLGKATHAGTGTSLGTAPATGATAGTTTTFAGVGSSSLFGGIGAFAGANALAIAVTGVALAAVVAVAAVGGAELGNKSKPKQADGEITNGLVAPKQEIAVPGTQPMPGITDQDTLFFDEAVVSSPTATSSLGTAELPPDTDTVQDSKSSGVSTVPKGLAPVQIPPAGINSLVPQQPVDSGIPALPAPTDDHVPSQAPQISETPAVGSNPAQKPEASVSGQPSETVKPTSPVNPSESSSAPASPSTETSAVPTVTPTDPTVEPTEPTVDPTEPTVSRLLIRLSRLSRLLIRRNRLSRLLIRLWIRPPSRLRRSISNMAIPQAPSRLILRHLGSLICCVRNLKKDPDRVHLM
ncbi:sigma-70 family RNA polymerase sigma factor [Arthrobacter sp. MYb227]|uniref:sigma-70 family RNA polymerase sigma factor n=1 Tax=Arthrobacter sp. MYb227 TaxID=1848601 RepID=UPI001C615AD1|nr:sigma-70 family RNA polymerase sigma factor [Arthrobacter sp. MYb227]